MMIPQIFFPPIHYIKLLANDFKSMAPVYRDIEQKTGVKITLDNKTIRKIFEMPQKATRKTRKRFDDLNKEILNSTGGSFGDYEFIEEDTNSISRWQDWVQLSYLRNDSLPIDLYPKTRWLIRKLAGDERFLAHEIRKGTITNEDKIKTIVNSALAAELSPDDMRLNVLQIVENKISEGVKAEKIFMYKDVVEWFFFVLVSLLLRLIASFDVEYTNNVIPENQKDRDDEIREVSFVRRILPSLEAGNPVMPITQTLRIWKEYYSTKDRDSWTALANHLGASDIVDKRRQLFSWLAGEHIPQNDAILQILKGMDKDYNEVSVQDEFLWYKISFFLTRLYKELRETFPKDVSDEEIIFFFSSFDRHRESALKEQGFL